MRTKYQKKVESLKYKFPFIPVEEFTGTSNNVVRLACINNEPYITVASLPKLSSLQRLKRWAEKHGCKPVDIFPAIASGGEYSAISFIVRVGYLKSGGEDLKNHICSENPNVWEDLNKERYDEAIRIAEKEWLTVKVKSNVRISEKECIEAIEVQKERATLIKQNPDESKPDVETCIKVLKEHGYKIMEPIIEYKEV